MFGLNPNGATVQFGAIPAPILYASSAQLNLQVPWELQGKSSSPVTVTGNSISSELAVGSSGAERSRYFLPGHATGRARRHRECCGSRGERQLAGPCRGLSANFRYRVGGGEQPTTDRSGSRGNPLSRLFSYPAVTIGGVQAPVSFAGPEPGFIGLYQVNVRVPQGVVARDGVPVVLSTGATASNAVTVSVR